MDNSASLIWGMIFGSIGVGYFVYGKKQQRFIAMLSGFALCVFPYFVSNTVLMVLIGIVLIALPFFIRS
jgi:hypothetical protein